MSGADCMEACPMATAYRYLGFTMVMACRLAYKKMSRIIELLAVYIFTLVVSSQAYATTKATTLACMHS